MPDWSKTAFIFPGQGSQIVGMGADFVQAYPAARDIFTQADSILGFALSELCFNGPQERLDETDVTQPALYVCGIAILRALQTEFPDVHPLCAAGHSLGEFTALTAAGALTFEAGLKLVAERARLMRDAGTQNPGGMAAVLGLDADALETVCKQAAAQTNGALVVANDNCPGQVVISGDFATLDVGMELAKTAGAKRVVKLAVSIAAHSPLMQPASDALGRSIAATDFTAPNFPVYANVSAAPLNDVTAIREELNQQLTHAVRWSTSVQAMIAAGVERFIEIGPKDVLSGLVKRIDRSKNTLALNSGDALKAII